MTRADELRELYAFNRWANARMLDAAAQLGEEQFTRDLGSSFGSLRDTLLHILSAEWIWLERWHGSSPNRLPEGWDSADLNVLRVLWRGVEERQSRFLEALDDSRLDEVLAYRTFAGDPYTSPLGQLLRHVVNHSSYHRGQAATLLRQLGVTPPATDLVLYHRTVAIPL
jgi:uncharacterized damage-inducible protein DinB